MINFFKFFVSSAKFSECIPFNNLIFKLIYKSLALFDFNACVINFKFQSLHHFDGLSLLNLNNDLINLWNLFKVSIDVLEHFWHFIFQSFNEFFFFISGAVSIHLISTLVNLTEFFLSNFKSFSELVVLNFK